LSSPAASCGGGGAGRCEERGTLALPGLTGMPWRSWLGLALLAALVVALAAALLVRPRTADEAGFAVTTLDRNAARHVTLERPGRPTVVLDQENGRWRLSAPYKARAEPFQVQRMLGILGARGAARFPSEDLARFELETPSATLTVNGERFAFGAINAVTREQYVRAGNSIYAVGLAHGAALPADAEALIQRQLFEPGEVPVRFELPRFSIALDAGRWRVMPASEDTGADAITGWVQRWRQAQALRAGPLTSPPGREVVRIELEDGRTLSLAIMQREPELVLARLDENVRFHFPVDTARQLLTPPRGNP